MTRNVALLLVFVFLTASLIMAAKPVSAAAPVENSWTSKAPMHVARSDLGVAVVNGKIYAIGGSNREKKGQQTSGGVVGTNEEYDPATDTWTYKASMPTPSAGFATAVYQNKIYCIEGKVNEVYDPATDTWETKTPMPTPRTGLQANVVNGKIYLIGGYVGDVSSGYSYLNLTDVYDPETDSWTTKAPMPTAVSSVTSAVIDSKIYIIMSDLNQIYDVNNDTWSLGTPRPPNYMSYARAGATTGINVPERIYIVGDSKYQVYDPNDESWTNGAAISTSRMGFGVAVVNDILYVAGGFTAAYIDFPDDWMYGPQITKLATNEQYTPFGYGTVPPAVAVVSPENETYTSSNVSLAFTINKQAVWMGYSLDGQDNVTVVDNITLTDLSNGLHNITVYAKDEFENMGASETIYFNVEVPEPFPIALIAAVSAATLAVVGVGLLAYFKKYHGTE
jgi:hypothetical protein